MLPTPAATRRLYKEINRLKSEPPEGIRIHTHEDNLLDITGIIAGPAGTPYEGGYFRVKFAFTDEFPASPPKCRMVTKIFHPNVSSAGEICVNTLKKDWKSSYGIEHILVTIKCLLIYPNPESALDEEAGRELLEDYESYSSRARLITSVHATPKTPPSEFDVPSVISKSSLPEPSTSQESKPPPAPTENLDTPSVTSPPPHPSLTLHAIAPAAGSENAPATNTLIPASKPRSKGPTSTPLVSVAPPPPLQSATNALQPGKEAPLAALKPEAKEVLFNSTKAVKRTATSAAIGADKRKKALKRL